MTDWRPIDLSTELAPGPARASLVDDVCFAVGLRIERGGPDRGLLEAMAPRLRSGEIRLPVLSATVARVMAMMDREDVDLAELTLSVEIDPGLSTKLVGIANSAYYRGVEPAGSVREAVMRMGLREARNVVAAVALRSTLFRVDGFEARAESIWVHSLLSALSLQALVADDERWADRGFLLGLVHDVGRIAVLTFAGELRERDGPEDLSLEAVMLSSDAIHAVVGALVLDSWSLPEDFVTTVRDHHSPTEIHGDRIELARSLFAADRLAHGIERDLTGTGDVVTPELEEMLDLLGRDADAAPKLVAEVSAAFSALANLI